MEFLQTVITKQNEYLLQMIANDKFKNKHEKDEFIHKYKKKNYQKIVITKETNIDHYANILRTFDLEHNNSTIQCEHNH
jgi:hypothetical protein